MYITVFFFSSRDFDSSSLTSFGISASSNWFSLSQQHYHTPVSGRVWPTPNSLPRIYFYSGPAWPRTRARARVLIFARKETKVNLSSTWKLTRTTQRSVISRLRSWRKYDINDSVTFGCFLSHQLFARLLKQSIVSQIRSSFTLYLQRNACAHVRSIYIYI